MSERRPCMPADGEISDTHRHQQNGSDDGGKTPKEEHPIRAGNVCGNGYPGIHNADGGGGGNGDKGAIAFRKKRTWTAEEDEKLKRSVEEHGVGNWMTIERCSGLSRTSKSCRLRWTNHLRPNLKKGSFTEAEERIVVMLHQKYGNKWSFIASKLPGRTDNEIKNFWHSRLRRCRKQYLDIYPLNLIDEKSPLGDLNVSDRNHLPSDDYSSAATDDTSHMSQFSFVHSEQQENPTTCYTRQKPSLVSTSTNQTQLLSPNPVPFSSPHGLSSSHQPQSPELYTTPMHPLPTNTTQSQLPSVLHSQLSTEPPPMSKFSSPEQGSTISVPSSSVSSHKLQGSPLVSQISSPFNSITDGAPTHPAKLHMSLKQPTASSSMLHTSSLPSPVSCNQKTFQLNIPTTPSPHSPSELKVATPLPSHSYLQVNPSMIQSLTYPPSCISSTLELPVTSPPLGSLTEMLLNSSLHLAEPCFLGFQLPQSQSSPCHSNTNRASSSTHFAVKSELPSIQYPENALRPIQGMKINLHKMDTESSGVQGAQIQEAPAKTDLLYPCLTEEDSLDKCLMNNNSCGKIIKNERTRDNSSNEGTFSYQSTKKEGFICEGWKTINSSGSRVLRKHLQGNFMVDKCSKTENVKGTISRREGLLTDISKTGVLLVESAKKERLVSKLLNEGSNSEVLLSQSPKTENVQFGEVSMIKYLVGESLSIEDSLTDISTEKDLRDDASDEDTSLVANSTLLETKNLQETLFNKSSWESVLLASYEQEEMLDLDVLGSQRYKTTLLKPDGINYELDSVQVALDQVLDKISRGNASPGLQGQEQELKTIDPLLIDNSSVNQFKSGNWGDDLDYVGPCEDDCLNKSLMTECAENLNKEFIEQIHVGGCWGDKLNGKDLLAVQDQQMILNESNLDGSQYTFSKMSSSVYPNVESRCAQPPADVLLEGGQWTKDSLRRNLKRRGSEDQSSRKRFLGESSSVRVNGLQELTLNDFIPSTTQRTTNHLLRSGVQCSGFAQYYSRTKVDREDDDHINNLPEELSSLLELFPTIFPEWNDISCETSSNVGSSDILGFWQHD